jgi:UDP-N-acetylmuramoylalanine--D-glutamate ligase
MERFKNKKVLIFGLGINDGGLGMAEFFLKEGAKLTITDTKDEEFLKPTLEKLAKYGDEITYHLGGHVEEDFVNNDIIVRNPGVKPGDRFLKIAQDAGKQIEMEMSLFHKLAPCPIIGITGTKGKSTTTTLISEFLKQKFGNKVFLGGNIGRSAIRELDSLEKDNICVLEISSYQSKVMGENRISSDIALVTNMYKDHLNWHPDMQDYIESKKDIFRYQDKDGILVVNIDNDITKEFPKDAPGIVKRFSLNDSSVEYYMDKDLNVYENGNQLLNIKTSILIGEHNHYNILGAIAVARIYDITPEQILTVLESFKGVSGRQELIRELNGIKFYNDTTATSVEAIEAMFKRFGVDYAKKIIMISGGVDKGLEYGKLVPYMEKYLKKLILLDGTASEKIMEIYDNYEGPFGDFKEAIDCAYKSAENGDMVILCPGASSFNMFKNEFDRGSQFVDIVNQLS